MPASPHFIQRLNKMMGPQSCAACALTHNPKVALSEVQRGRAEQCVRAEPRWKEAFHTQGPSADPICSPGRYSQGQEGDRPGPQPAPERLGGLGWGAVSVCRK